MTDELKDPFSLEGKRILITGASSGIGRQTAITCANMGAKAVIIGRNADRLMETFKALSGTGHENIVADLTVPDDIATLAARAGMLDGLVHAAGISRLVPLRMLKQTHLDEMFTHNTYAPILLTKELLVKRALAAKSSVVFITAVAAHAGPVATLAYAASKSALLGASRSMAEDLARQEIRVNCIAPGYVETPMLERLGQTGGSLEERAQWAPLGIGQPEDVANAVGFHLSDASQSVNCGWFVVDGGISASMRI